MEATALHKRDLVILGAGGLAREAFDLATVCIDHGAPYNIKGFISDNPSNIESLGYPPVLGRVDAYSMEKNDVFFCAIGKVHDRMKVVEKINGKGGVFINLIHPKALISPSAKIGVGVAIKANTSISSDCIIGNHTYFQGAVILGHDVEIGPFCQLNSFSFIAGNCKIEELCYISAGAKILQGVRVGASATVGMGSVVLRNVKKGATVFGIPAKEII